MSADPRDNMFGMVPPYYGTPRFPPGPNHPYGNQPAQAPVPFNVLNTPYQPGVQVGKPKAYGYGALPYGFFNQTLKNPTKEQLEEEYNKIMGPYTQGKKSQQDQQKHQEEQKSGGQKGQQQQSNPSKKKKSNAMISFDKLSAGTVSSSSGIFNGKNIQFGWSSHSKTNNGFGTLGGNSNEMHNNLNIVFDNDQLDTPIDDRDIMWSPVPNSSV